MQKVYRKKNHAKYMQQDNVSFKFP